jgi:iron complex transport system permease protein
LHVRGPRVLAAVLVGAALAVAGTAFQGLFRNPLVSPDLLGASSGAALGAVLGIYFALGVFTIEVCAFVGGLLAVGSVYLIGSAMRARDPILVLVLTGVVIGGLLGSGVGLVKYIADPYNQLPAMTFWLLGSLAATTDADLVPLFGPVAFGTLVLVALRWRRSARARCRNRAAARGRYRSCDSGDIGERRHGRYHRLGRPRGTAYRTNFGRARFRPGASGRGGARRRVSARHRHARAHRDSD